MNRAFTRGRMPALLVSSLIALALMATAAAGQAPAITFHHESLAAFEKQLAAGQVKTAEFNKKAHSLHLQLSNGEYALVDYPSGHEEPGLKAKLEAKGVPVSIEKVKGKTKAAHHTLRYIAGGIVVIVIIVVTAVLLIDRRRKLGEAGGGTVHADTGADSP